MTLQSATSETDRDASRKQPRSRWRRAVHRRLVTMLILGVLYVLSVGPFYWQWYESKFIGGNPFFAVLYEPLYRLCAAVPPVGWAVDQYVMLWIA